MIEIERNEFPNGLSTRDKNQPSMDFIKIVLYKQAKPFFLF